MNTHLPLTHAALCLWPRWREASAGGRTALAARLHPDEQAGLARWEAALQQAGSPRGWFVRSEHAGLGLALLPEVLGQLLGGLRVQERAVPELVRACRELAPDAPLGGPLTLEQALRERVRDGWIYVEETQEMSNTNGAVAERPREAIMADVRSLLNAWQAQGVDLRALTEAQQAELAATGASSAMLRGAIGGRLQVRRKVELPSAPVEFSDPKEWPLKERIAELEAECGRLTEQAKRPPLGFAPIRHPATCNNGHALPADASEQHCPRCALLEARAEIGSAHAYLDQAGVPRCDDFQVMASLTTRLDLLAGTLEARLRERITDERLPTEAPEPVTVSVPLAPIQEATARVLVALALVRCGDRECALRAADLLLSGGAQ